MSVLLYSISRSQFFSGCLLSAIAHAIMTNKYPMLSYEQSWDGCNCLINTETNKSTISFDKTFCVGAIRNYDCSICSGKDIYNLLINKFPSKVRNLLKDETLEYMFDYYNELVVPMVSSVFWCDREQAFFSAVEERIIEQDVKTILPYFIPYKQGVEYWKRYYEMGDDSVKLLLSLFDTKSSDFCSPIYLTKNQRALLPGTNVDDECIIALKELNIYL